MIQHIKRGCKAVLHRLGYKIHALSQPNVLDVDFKAAMTVKESQYYSQWEGPCPFFREKDAVDEFFADKPEFSITLPTGWAIILKVPTKEDPLICNSRM